MRAVRATFLSLGALGALAAMPAWAAGAAAGAAASSTLEEVVVTAQKREDTLQKTALFGLWSLFPYAGYLVAVYFGSVRWPLAVTLGVATAVWVLMALGMIVLWGRLHPSAAGA